MKKTVSKMTPKKAAKKAMPKTAATPPQMKKGGMSKSKNC